MKSTFFVAALAGTAFAYPKGAMKDLFSAVAKRGEWAGSSELWGEWTSGGPQEIKALLQGKGSGISYDGYKAPAMDSEECKKDKCCIWHYITAELYGLMHDDATNTCNDFARACVRMGFHDAAAWQADLSEGGADGSLLLAGELSRFENGGGIGTNAPALQAVFDKYESYSISMADLIQAASKVGTLACPGGPRIRMFIGRTDSTTPAPQGLLPSPFATAEEAIDLFGKKTVSPGGLIALLGAHTASRNHAAFVGPLGPQDITPGKWDTEYFKETLKTNASEGVTRFVADTNLAQSEVTKGSFEFFEGNKGAWDEAYAFEYIRMSLFGVKGVDKLLECTKAMPKGKVPDEPDYPSSSSTTKYPHSTSTKDDYPHSTSTKDDYPHTTKTKDDYPHSTKTKDDYPHTTKTKKPHKPTYTTSTIYTRSTITLYSCPPEVKDCPYNKDRPHVTYTEYPVSTTVCEVTPTYEPEYPEETSAVYPVVPEKYTAPGPAVDYPSASASYAAPAPVGTSKSAPVVVAGAGRTAGGVLVAAAGIVVAALM